MGDLATTSTAGTLQRGYRRGATGTGLWDQYVIYSDDKILSYEGRAATFRIPGSGATSPQHLCMIHNATGSAVLVDVTRILVDLTSTATKTGAETYAILRAYAVTVLPTNGSALTKVPLDSALSSSASVTLLQGASADRTASATALTATLPANTVIEQVSLSRFLNLSSSVERSDRVSLLDEKDRTLRALEGIVVTLEDYTPTTINPATDWYTVVIEWIEYTRP